MSEKLDFSENLFPFDRPEESTGFLIWRVSNLWQREMKNILADEDLTHTQFMLLGGVFWHHHKKQIVTQKQLSESSRIDKMTVSAVLRTLEKKGLLRRETDSEDSRAKNIVMTETGFEAFRKAIGKALEIGKTLFTNGSEDDRQVTNRYLADILGRYGEKF